MLRRSFFSTVFAPFVSRLYAKFSGREPGPPLTRPAKWYRAETIEDEIDRRSLFDQISKGECQNWRGVILEPAGYQRPSYETIRMVRCRMKAAEAFSEAFHAAVAKAWSNF